jgi:hypothetical protein
VPRKTETEVRGSEEAEDSNMGIKGLTKLLADNAPGAMKEQKFESYFGRRIAIDASMSIYQFLVRQNICGLAACFITSFCLSKEKQASRKKF